MPFFATILMGIAGQVGWKLVSHLYDRFTGKGASEAAGAQGQSFARSLADASGRAPQAAPAAVAPSGPMFASASGLPLLLPASGAGATPAMKAAIESYRSIQRVEAP
jgi:hypothetical protein